MILICVSNVHAVEVDRDASTRNIIIDWRTSVLVDNCVYQFI